MDSDRYGLPRHLCRHRLSISTGWSGGMGDCSVWCCYCKASIDARTDTDWDARYKASRGYSPHAEAAKAAAR